MTVFVAETQRNTHTMAATTTTWANRRVTLSLKPGERITFCNGGPIDTVEIESRLPKLGSDHRTKIYAGHLVVGKIKIIPVILKVVRNSSASHEEALILQYVHDLALTERITPNLIGIRKDPDYFIFATQKIDGVTMDEKLRELNETISDSDETAETKSRVCDEQWDLVVQGASALRTLHKKDVVHGDPHLENFMCPSEGTKVLVIDFGSATDVRKPQMDLRETMFYLQLCASTVSNLKNGTFARWCVRAAYASGENEDALLERLERERPARASNLSRMYHCLRNLNPEAAEYIGRDTDAKVVGLFYYVGHAFSGRAETWEKWKDTFLRVFGTGLDWDDCRMPIHLHPSLQDEKLGERDEGSIMLDYPFLKLLRRFFAPGRGDDVRRDLAVSQCFLFLFKHTNLTLDWPIHLTERVTTTLRKELEGRKYAYLLGMLEAYKEKIIDGDGNLIKEEEEEATTSRKRPRRPPARDFVESVVGKLAQPRDDESDDDD